MNFDVFMNFALTHGKKGNDPFTLLMRRPILTDFNMLFSVFLDP
ncbi:hypothetical protein JGUZn3_02280 [Entomobacter blattae]|uniref:Uncharacterized protein n=1 Tax=Entomobacter blattae TaxID=2762277 RepID=A0A7H1NNX6_9PROT|nr:hypothetical protein JGUZn3_02280 [Entomobacter blattae]